MSKRIKPSLWPESITICNPGKERYGRRKRDNSPEIIPVCAIGHLRHEFGLLPDNDDYLLYNIELEDSYYDKLDEIALWKVRYRKIAECNGIDSGTPFSSAEEINDYLSRKDRRALYLATWLSFKYDVRDKDAQKMFDNYLKNKRKIKS